MRISAYTDFRFYGTALPENAESRPPWCSLFRQPGLEPRPYARRRNTSAISFYALGACTSRWPLRRFVECGSGSHVVPLTIFPRCAYGRDAPKHGAGLGSQSSSRASESTITLIRKCGSPEMRVCGNERAHARRALSRCLRLAECRCRVEYIVGGLLGLGGGGYHHALVATEFGEPALNIRGLILEDSGRNSRLGAQISG